mgnify:CR=1 FL=1
MRMWMLAVIALLLSLPAMAQPNPFGVGKPDSAPVTAKAEPAAAPLITLPTPVRALFRQVADWQRDLNRFLSGRLRESSQIGRAHV